MKEVNAIQANLSTQAARINVAPTRKMKTFLSSISAATLVQFTSILLLLCLSGLSPQGGLRQPDRLYRFACAFTGCITGVSFGAMISALSRGGEGIKTGILISTTMVLSFLAGMMFVQVKYVVTAAIPAYLPTSTRSMSSRTDSTPCIITRPIPGSSSISGSCGSSRSCSP